MSAARSSLSCGCDVDYAGQRCQFHAPPKPGPADPNTRRVVAPCDDTSAHEPHDSEFWPSHCPGVVPLGESGVAAVKRLTTLCAEMDATLLAIYNLDPEAHATKSRDYGRGFAEALRIVRAEIDTRMGAWAASQTSTGVDDTPNPRASDDPAQEPFR